MTSTKQLALALLLALAVPACTANVGSDVMDEAESDDNGTKEDGVARPEGSYSFDGRAYPGTITELTLNADRTATFSWATFGGGRALRIEQVAGTYRFTKSGRNRFIRFFDADGELVNRYQYRLANDTLQLKVDWSDTWFAMSPGVANIFAFAESVKEHFMENFDFFVLGQESEDIPTVTRDQLPQSAKNVFTTMSRVCASDDSCTVKAYSDAVDGRTVFYVVGAGEELAYATIFDANGVTLADGEYSNGNDWAWGIVEFTVR